MTILCCPACRSQLRLETSEVSEDVLSGALVCNGCSERYPIQDGIPVLLPADLRGAIEPKGANRP